MDRRQAGGDAGQVWRVEEESGLHSDDYLILDKIQPLIEMFIGTNGIRYKHIYYIGIAKTNKFPSIENNNQKNEIGGIQYFTLNEALKCIRPYHISRKSVLIKLNNFVINKLISEINSTIDDVPNIQK